jgi:hypothetical protein
MDYEILDYSYAPRANELGTDLAQKVLKLPRSLLFAVQQDLAVRMLGGFSLLVLAR